jgi:hypothetical protein
VPAGSQHSPHRIRVQQQECAKLASKICKCIFYSSEVLVSVQFFYKLKELQLNIYTEQEKIVGSNHFLHHLAQEAYRSYIEAYNSLTMKETFNVHGLNLKVIKMLLELCVG